MPRQARKKSSSGIYHVMLRGINKQQIFEDEEDCERFLWVLKETKAVSEFKLFAYCLMGNHIHLLLKPEKEELEQIFKRIGSRYVYWYNWKYHRTGHLFQDRYKSEPVEDESYFLTVLRYIHQNPKKAELCENLDAYRYSSYHTYLNGLDKDIVDTKFATEIMNEDELIGYFNEPSNDVCLDVTKNERKNDTEAREEIFRICGCKNATEFQNLNIEKRNEVIRELKESGLSIRQISRLTGISFGVVRKC